MADSMGKNKLSLKRIVPEIINCSRSDGDIAKGHRNQSKEVPNSQADGNLSIKINNNCKDLYSIEYNRKPRVHTDVNQ